MRMKLILLLSLSVFSINLNAQSYSGPESVEYDYINSRWLIANTQSHQVLARDNSGVLSIFVTLTGSGPYGIEIVGDTLYCCNGSSIKGFLLSNATQVFNVNVGATFLNGITHDNAGNLIATDFSAKAIYKINIASHVVTPIATGMNTTPNGIIFDEANNRCVYVNWSTNAPIKAIDLSTNAISTLASTTLGSCDGITRDSQGNYYVSTWSTQSIVKFDSAFSSSPVTVVTGLNNPADIFYNVQDDTLAIPNAGNNTVIFQGFGTVGIEEFEFEMGLYPMPCTSYLNVTSIIKMLSYQITDINGRVLMTGDFYDNYFNQIDIDQIENGVYYIVLNTQNGLVKRSIVKLDN